MCKTLSQLPQHKELRRTLGQFSTGVAVVTTNDEQGLPVGMTINSFSSVSMMPALVSWCIDFRAAGYPVFKRCDHFAISVLSWHQQAIARRFAKQGANKFCGIEIVPGEPVFLPEACAWLECELYNRFLLGDHLMLIGRVIQSERFQTDPLVFSHGEFHHLHTCVSQPLAATD